MRRPLVIVWCALALAACSPFGAEAPSDGGAATDGGGLDAAGEGGAPASPCTKPAAGTLFCEDFETPKPFFGFTDDVGSAGAFEASRVLVAGRGHVLSFRASLASSGPNAWLRFSPPPASLAFQALDATMSFAVVTQGAESGVVLGFFLYGFAAAEVRGIESGPSGYNLDGSLTKGSPAGKPNEPGQWHNLRLRLEKTGATEYTRIAYIDGAEVDRHIQTSAATAWDLRVGFYYARYVTADLLFDDIVLTRE